MSVMKAYGKIRIWVWLFVAAFICTLAPDAVFAQEQPTGFERWATVQQATHNLFSNLKAKQSNFFIPHFAHEEKFHVERF